MTVASILDTAVSRALIGEHDGRSGGSLERVLLADGRRLLVKRTSYKTDIVRILTGDAGGRELGLWRAGVLDRLCVGHAVLDGWADDDDTVVVMRDLGGAVFGWDHVLSPAEVAQVLAGMAALHDAGAQVPAGLLVPLDQRVGMFAPARMRRLVADFPLAGAVLDGWGHFGSIVDSDVASAVLRLLDQPSPLVAALSRRPCTMIHGDLWPVNVALTADGPVLLDWGLASWAPPALDLAWFLAGAGAANVAMTREEVIQQFRALSGSRCDDEAMALALLCSLVDFGWNKALDAATAADAEARERHHADLNWWVEAARVALRPTLR